MRSSGASVGVGLGEGVGVFVGVISVETVSSIIVVAADCSTSVLAGEISEPAVPTGSVTGEQAIAVTDSAAVMATARSLFILPVSPDRLTNGLPLN